MEQYITSLNEEKIKALVDPDNSYGFNFDSLIKITLDNFVSQRLIYREDEEKVNKMLSMFFDGDQFLKDTSCYFNYNEFVVPKINEKLYPKKKPPNKTGQIEDIITSKNSNKNISSALLHFSIPKSAVIELFEKISDEKYYNLLYGISKEMFNNNTSKNIYDFYNIFARNKTDESFEIKPFKNEINELPIIFNINAEQIMKMLEEVRLNLPDQLNTADTNPSLFKVNKYNEFLNPLDECLQKEIDTYNSYITFILKEIENIKMILK